MMIKTSDCEVTRTETRLSEEGLATFEVVHVPSKVKVTGVGEDEESALMNAVDQIVIADKFKAWHLKRYPEYKSKKSLPKAKRLVPYALTSGGKSELFFFEEGNVPYGKTFDVVEREEVTGKITKTTFTVRREDD